MKRVLLLSFLLAGCSYFTNADDHPVSRPANEDTAAAVESCREQANAVIARDASIDRDIGTAQPSNQSTADVQDLQLSRNLDRYGTQQRFRDIVSDCMRQRSGGKPSSNTTSP